MSASQHIRSSALKVLEILAVLVGQATVAVKFYFNLEFEVLIYVKGQDGCIGVLEESFSSFLEKSTSSFLSYV